VRIVLGITGSVAAYKGAELARLLVRDGHEVRALLTAAGQRFVTPLQLQALTGHPVPVDLWQAAGPDGMEHLELARWAEALVIAPATADIIARLAHGLADDVLSTVALAFTGPLFVAPAMNPRMLEHPATRANLELLAGRGVHLLETQTGELACGEVGPGRMAAPAAIAARVLAGPAAAGDYQGVRALVTAGPTREALDVVRTISNRSTGRMGFALAEALRRRGAEVRLVAGPTPLEPPAGLAETVRVETTAELARAVGERFEDCDLLIMAAAPSDWRPADPGGSKRPRGEGAFTLTLEPTEDILAGLAPRKGDRGVIGFALEAGEPAAAGRAKLERKGLDAIAVNAPGLADEGPGAVTNRITLVHRGGEVEEFGLDTKERLAHALLDAVRRYVRVPPR
jgi:phosphopantothenoylcysteine decarboxylase/phosphopantothenate--cysteine ligase